MTPRTSDRSRHCMRLLLATGLLSGLAAAADCPRSVPTGGPTKPFNVLVRDGRDLYGIPATGGSRVVQSRDEGATWVEVGPRIPFADSLYPGSSWGLAKIGPRIFLGMDEAGLFSASVDDTAWSSLASGFPGHVPVSSLAMGGSALYAAGDSGIYKTADSGRQWSYISQGIRKGIYSDIIAIIGNDLFVGVNGNLRGRPTDSGYVWSNIQSKFMRRVVQHGAYLFANAIFLSGVADYNFGRSEDGGLTWKPLAPDSLTILPTLEGNLLAVSGGKVWRSPDEGLSWRYCLDYSQPALLAYSDDVNGEGILMASNRILWRPAASASALPRTRPADGSGRMQYRHLDGIAKVSYKLEQAGLVRLGLFSSSGKSLLPILQGYRPKGTGEVSFSTTSLKGMYWLVLEAGKVKSSMAIFAD